MKIQCDGCQRVEAAVLCCADEAALCLRCDEQVHAANKLAGKHQRVPLLGNPASSSASCSSQVLTCDICQERTGFFFCLEDRALLCRQCDVATHTTNSYMRCHQRFLITGVKVALENYLTTTNGHNSSATTTNNDKSYESSNDYPQSSQLPPADSPAMTDRLPTTPVDDATGGAEGYKSQWPWNELFDVTEFDQCYNLSEPGSSC